MAGGSMVGWGSELHVGVGRGYVGHVRGAPLGIEEEILSAGMPIDDPVDSDGGRPSLAAARRNHSKIPSICYKINKFGLFPIQDHLAFVQFVDVAASPETGEGRGLVGHRRLVSLGVEEQIVSAGPPNSSDRIPTVRYSIKKSGPLLLSEHVALVQFVADSTAPPSQPKTLILWNSKLTPSTVGSVLLCGGSISRLVLRTVLSSSLSEIAASFQKK
ncbi:hypothetical protein GQ600_4030 [Phytophthora cactorum]|nr:hypothetical protein GQ600_4030 [Phytophthora cactorum]